MNVRRPSSKPPFVASSDRTGEPAAEPRVPIDLLQRAAAQMNAGAEDPSLPLDPSFQRVIDLAKDGRIAHERLAAIVRSSDDAIITKDLTGIITSWNPAAERIFGYTAGEMIGQSILRLIPEDRHDEETTILSRLRRGEHIDHYETIRRHKDGSDVDIALTVSPLRSENGEIFGASKIARDITHRRRAERQQRALYQLVACINGALDLPEVYEAALDAILLCRGADRAAILLCDASGTMRFAAWRGLSEAYRRAVDGHSPWAREAADPQPINVSDVTASDLSTELRLVLAREGIRSLAFVPLQVDRRLLGKFMVYQNIPRGFTAEELQPIVTISSQVAFAIERRRHADALEALVRERTASLQSAIEQMEEFSYSVSHDIRAPIRAMRGYAQMLIDDFGPRLDPTARELIGRIHRNGTRMERMIQDLLTYTRVARREMSADLVSLDRLVREVIECNPEMAPDRVDIEIVETLPEVMAHEPSLTQVISNLLGNAVKFVARGTRPHVRIGSERTPGRLRLWFEDNGVGIRPEFHARVFGMFERFHSQGEFEGTGIGLAIVRKAVERMGGTVGVVSDGRTGCRFWIELPAAPPD